MMGVCVEECVGEGGERRWGYEVCAAVATGEAFADYGGCRDEVGETFGAAKGRVVGCEEGCWGWGAGGCGGGGDSGGAGAAAAEGDGGEEVEREGRGC